MADIEKDEKTKEQLENDRQYELNMLKSSWDMYEKTKKETLERRSTAKDKSGNKIYSEASTHKTMELLETMQEDIKAKYLSLGGTIEELTAKKQTRGRKPSSVLNKSDIIKKIIQKEKERINNGDEEVQDDEYGGFVMDVRPPVEVAEPEPVQDTPNFAVSEPSDELSHISVDPTKAKGNTIKYDVIPLPSKGQCYKNKISKVPVAYLTAYDENMIISPNMYKDGTFLDHILSAKIMTDEIDAMDMVQGDRDAIVLWLRASGYGTDFPVTATDTATGTQFESVVDLRKLKYKKFTLKGDANGYFEFTLPFSGDKVKFKFLTRRDILKLEEMDKEEVTILKKRKIQDLADSVEDTIAQNDDMSREDKTKLNDAVTAMRKYASEIDDTNTSGLYSHSVTNKLCAQIMSVNGVTDRKYVEEYVSFMNVKDSSALRHYIVENEPGIDFNIEVERPKSLGGGSVSMFLTIDQFIFLSVA